MVRLAWGIEAALGPYLSAHFPELMRDGEYVPHKAVGFVDENDRLIGALGLRYENAFEGQLSIYTERPGFFTRGILRELFTWAFRERGLSRLTCHVAKRNRKARAMVERLGFRLEGVKRKGFDGRRDAVIFGMTDDQCPWLRKD